MASEFFVIAETGTIRRVYKGGGVFATYADDNKDILEAGHTLANIVMGTTQSAIVYYSWSNSDRLSRDVKSEFNQKGVTFKGMEESAAEADKIIRASMVEFDESAIRGQENFKAFADQIAKSRQIK